MVTALVLVLLTLNGLVNYAAAVCRRVEVQLTGEPKSGTTWGELMAYDIARKFCTPSRKCSGYSFFLNSNSDPASRSFEIAVDNDDKCILFQQMDKHRLPFVHESIISIPELINPTAVHCQHGGTIADKPPQFIKMIYPNEDITKPLRELDILAHHCITIENRQRSLAAPNKQFHTPSTHYIHMVRDPRDVAVSICLSHEKGGVVNNETAFVECVYKLYAAVAVWIKYRELIIHRSPERSTIICYEGLISPDDSIRHGEFRKYVAVFFGENMAAGLSPAELSPLEAGLLPEAHRIGGPEGGGNKVHSAGRKFFFDYFRNESMARWMNATYRALEEHHPSPCGKLRDLHYII